MSSIAHIGAKQSQEYTPLFSNDRIKKENLRSIWKLGKQTERGREKVRREQMENVKTNFP